MPGLVWSTWASGFLPTVTVVMASFSKTGRGGGEDDVGSSVPMIQKYVVLIGFN